MSDHPQSALRLAIISTPRSGNTWLRALLAGLYDLEQRPVHFPDQIDWENLPERCVIQIHWYPVESFVTDLERYGVRVVVLARHPLDVLLSWLNYSNYDHMEGFCPGRETCDKCDIIGVEPRSEALRSYVRGHIGHWLLGHSPAWWDRPGVVRVRYEDLVAGTEYELRRLTGEVGEAPRRPLNEVVESTSMGQMKGRHDVWQYHYWQGRPDLWRSMFPAAEARAIARAMPEAFDTLGYSCEADASLTAAEADRNWLRLQLDSIREHIGKERSKTRKKEDDLTALRHHLAWAHQALAEEQRAHAETRRLLESVRNQPGPDVRVAPGAMLVA